MATYLADRVIVYEGRPSIDCIANSPQSLLTGMNLFLSVSFISCCYLFLSLFFVNKKWKIEEDVNKCRIQSSWFCFFCSIWTSHLGGIQLTTGQELINWTQPKTGIRRLQGHIITWMIETKVPRLFFSSFYL